MLPQVEALSLQMPSGVCQLETKGSTGPLPETEEEEGLRQVPGMSLVWILTAGSQWKQYQHGLPRTVWVFAVCDTVVRGIGEYMSLAFCHCETRTPDNHLIKKKGSSG